jgi:Ca-activated chloride channel family protein
MNWATGQFLWLAAALAPLTAWFLWWTWRRKQRGAQVFVKSRLFAQLTVGLSPFRQIAKRVLLGLAVVTLLLALARPRWGYKDEETTASGLDIVVCFDVSRSMLGDDAKPNRLAKAKLAAFDLLSLSKSDRLGLVAFAGSAFLQCPLALDDEAFRQSVRALDTDIIPEQGTALADAIREAVAAFGKDSTGARAVVIFSDGEDHEPGAVEAAKAAAQDGIRIFTLGVGTAAGAVLRTADPFGNPVFVRDEQGNAVRSKLNEDALKQVADAGGGFYLPLQNRQTIQTLYERGLDVLPRADLKAGKKRQWIERFQWPLGLGILLLMFEVLLPEQRRTVARRKPDAMFADAAAAVK